MVTLKLRHCGTARQPAQVARLKRDYRKPKGQLKLLWFVFVKP